MFDLVILTITFDQPKNTLTILQNRKNFLVFALHFFKKVHAHGIIRTQLPVTFLLL